MDVSEQEDLLIKILPADRSYLENQSARQERSKAGERETGEEAHEQPVIPRSI